MRVKFGVVVAAVLATSGTATSATSQRPVYQPPKGYYLALGDSISYGFQPNKPKTALPTAFDTGYVDVFAARLRKLSPRIRVVNYSCPGESTRTFTAGGCEGRRDVKALHNEFKGAQLGAALAFLRGHRGQVSPITVTLFGNDWFPFVYDRCKGKPACIRSGAPREIASLRSRLSSILERLRAEAPTSEIIVTGAWNIDPGLLVPLQSVYKSLDTAIARAATASRARFAHTLPVFNPAGSVQEQKARLCAYSFFCSNGDPHPTNAGYRALAAAVFTASGYPRQG